MPVVYILLVKKVISKWAIYILKPKLRNIRLFQKMWLNKQHNISKSKLFSFWQ